MVIFLFLFINIFSISYQTVQAAFFCDDDIQDIYVVKGNEKKKIADKIPGNCYTTYYYKDLAAIPGDLIYFGCDNAGKGITFGAGCFYIYDTCHCYMFENVDGIQYDYSSSQTRIADFGSKICMFNGLHALEEKEVQKMYYYQNYVPLDASRIQCKSYSISLPKNEISTVKISNFITADFDTKNVEVTIIENYDYFTLNSNKLQKDTKFDVTKDLYFSSKETKLIKVKFTNYGKILSATKDCEFYIRVCNERCSECDAYKEPSENAHRCLKCKNGYYLAENKNTFNCWTKNEMYEKGYYLDEKSDTFKKCYADCKTCSIGGNSNDMKCDSCSDDPNKYLIEPHNCISDITHYYYSKEDKIYKKCYERCYSCNEKGTANEHNCNKCEESYHFIYNETGKCISESEKPSNTYLDTNNNVYRLWYERCSTCDKGGDESNNNCKDCAKDKFNNYSYHFIYNEKGKCISESEKPSNTYLDNIKNTYRLCNESDGISNKYIIIGIILSIILIVVLAIIAFLCYRKKPKENKMINKFEFELDEINGYNIEDNT